MIDWNKIPNVIANQNALANNSTHAIAVVDMEGWILMANESATEAFGYESLEGMNTRDIAPLPHRMLFTPEFMATRTGHGLAAVSPPGRQPGLDDGPGRLFEGRAG